MKNRFIIKDIRKGTGRVDYVSAPPGYYRKADGTIARDGCFNGGPEWTSERSEAFHFQSHRSAARTANKCITATITPA